MKVISQSPRMQSDHHLFVPGPLCTLCPPLPELSVQLVTIVGLICLSGFMTSDRFCLLGPVGYFQKVLCMENPARVSWTNQVNEWQTNHHSLYT